MQLNLRTAVTLIVGLALLVQLLAMAVRGSRRIYPGYSRWAVAGLLLVLSFFLMSLRGAAPGWISIVAANAGIAMASILYLEGAREFRGLAPHSWFAYAGGILATAAVAFFYYVIPNMNTRAVVMSTFFGLILAVVSIGLLRVIPPAQKFSQALTGAMFGLCAATLVARACYCYFGPPMSDQNALSGVYGIFFMAIVAEIASIVILLNLLADDRVISDLHEVKEHASRADAEVVRHVATEVVLRQSEERFRALADTAPVMIWMSGPDKLGTFFNKPWLDFRGRTLEQELGKGWVEGVHPEDRDRCSAVYNSAFDSRRPFQKECRLRRADGEYRWVLDNGTPRYREGAFEGYIGSCIDVTEQKQAEEELRSNHARLINSRRLANVGSWERDVATGRIRWSDQMYRIFGLPDGTQTVFQTFLSLVHPKDLGIIAETEKRALAANVPVVVEYRATRPDGEVRFIRSVSEAVKNEQGVPVGFAGTDQDITEQVKATELLRESEARLKYAERLAHLGHWQWDLRTNQVSGSEEMYRIFGHPPDSPPSYGGFLQELVSQDKERVERAIRDSLANKTGCSIEYQIAHANGDLRTVSCTWEILVDEDGSPVRMFGTCQDVTDVRRSQEESLARQKLESLGTLASGIAHDFNNLLGAVLAQAELAAVELAAGSHPEEELKEIRTVAVRGSEIVRQLMVYAGKESDVLEPVDVSRVVEEMLGLLKVTVSPHATLRTDFGTNLSAVKARAAQLRQIVMNLVMNASDAIQHGGGVIRVTTRCVSVGRDVAGAMAEGLSEGDYIELEVSDSGCGMAKETQARMFDPFFTTKSAGRGLGLAVVHGIVRSLNGAIRVESELYKGTTFQVLLPCVATVTGAAAGAYEGMDEVPQSPREATLLVVEDEEPLRQAVKKMLGKAGFEVLEAADGSDAIERLRASAGDIDLLLLDMTIPGATSQEVLAEAVQARPNMKVVLTSAYGEEMVSANLSGPQVRGFVRKPFQFKDLTRALRNALSSSPAP